MAKKTKRVRVEEEKQRLETKYFRDEPWITRWVEAITAPPVSEAGRRLCQLLSGPEPVQGVPSRPPSFDAVDLFTSLVVYLDIPVTSKVMGGLDNLILAIISYGRRNHIDLLPLVADWAQSQFLGLAGDLRGSGEVDTEHIASSLLLARMFALELGYFVDGWENLRQGLGLRFGDECVSPSTLIGSCAQLLGGGHRIRKWCAGVGSAERPNWFKGWFEEPSGRQDFHEILSAVDRQHERTEDVWAKAVLLATKEHFEFGYRDLTSAEVYHIIFERTKPGVFATPGDEAPPEVDGDVAEQQPDEAVVR